MINPEVVKAQIAGLLARFPELQDDQEALEMSLESETDAASLIDQIVGKLQNANAMETGLSDWLSALRARIDIYARRQEALRHLAFKIMETAGIAKMERPLATLSIVMGPRKVVITDEKLIPNTLMRHPPPEPDKTAISARLKAGNVVQGAFLSNGEQTLRIKVR